MNEVYLLRNMQILSDDSLHEVIVSHVEHRS
jgi:hypothetical protein